MKPTIASATMWIARKALLQARQKRFLRAAAILHWQRFIGVAASVWLLHSVMGTTPFQIWVRVAYLLIAIGYVWMDLHYGIKDLKRRVKWHEVLTRSRNLQRS